MNRHHESHRIGLIGGLILASLTLVSGLAVYAVMQRQAETILVKSLEASLQGERRLFESEIAAGVTNALAVSTRPFVIHNLQLLMVQPESGPNLRALQDIADSFLQTGGFSGIVFFDIRDVEVVRAGYLSEHPVLSVPLETRVESHLLWDDEFILRVVRDVVDATGTRIGTARTETTLPHLTRAISDAGTFGKTAELAICAPLESDMQCFPLTRTQSVTTRIARSIGGAPLPMSHALDGKTGTIFTQDYRREKVVAAYTPLGALGPGMVLKIDRSELFGPVNRQFWVIVPLLGGLVLVGMLLLYGLVAPLVKRLILSRQEARAASEKLRDLEERWRFALDSTGAGVWDLDIASDRILLSSRCKSMLGFEDSEIGTSLADWHARIHPDDQPALQAARLQVFDGRSDTFTNEHRKRCKNGDWKWVQVRGMVAARDAAGAPVRLIGTFIDISARKDAEETIRRQAHFDPLTQLPNRRLFLDRLEQEVAQSQRADAPLALLLIDLDEFKEVNDTLGHDVGDTLLQEAALRIRSCVRDSDTVARLGGDEFTVLLAGLSDRTHIEAIAQKIIERLAAPYQLGDEVAYVSASIGITLHPGDAADIETLMKHADQAMYAAKRQGRNRFSHFTASLQHAAQARLKLSRELHEAVDSRQFVIHFQPIVELSSGRIHKAEALLRWQHPERGLVEPRAFISLAEDTGLVNAIGEWAFRESARHAQDWCRAFGADFQISVNMSPLQFRADGPARIEGWIRHLQGIGLAGNNLIVEITENLLLNVHADITDQLFQLRNAGLQIAIDDFGTGYSSLSYLKQFPIDYLKIDRSFVRDLETDPNDMALSRAIIMMAHELGLKVIAEGVETEGQGALLASAGCDYAQGYLYAHPLPPDAFEALMRSRRDQ